MRRNLVVTALVAVIMAGFVLAYTALGPDGAEPSMAGITPTAQPGAMDGMAPPDSAAPPVKGFADGREILFIHTEESDPAVADMLTRMMASPVLLVPSLAGAPATMLATVYVFKNGVQGDGPFGFQPDVFDAPPGSDGYSPLRAVHLVTWRDGSTPRALRSAAEVEQAQARGEITVQRSGAVVNMPFITWPDGQR